MVSNVIKTRFKVFKRVFFPEFVIIMVLMVISTLVTALTPNHESNITCSIMSSTITSVTMLLMMRIFMIKFYPFVRQQTVTAINHARDELHEWTDEACFDEEWRNIKKGITMTSKGCAIALKIYIIFIVAIACYNIAPLIGNLASMQDHALQAVKIVMAIMTTTITFFFSFVVVKYCLVAMIQHGIAKIAVDDVKKRTSRE